MALPFGPDDFPRLQPRDRAKKCRDIPNTINKQLERAFPDIKVSIVFCNIPGCPITGTHLYYSLSEASERSDCIIVGWYQKHYPGDQIHGDLKDGEIAHIKTHHEKIDELTLKILELEHLLMDARVEKYAQFQENEKLKRALTQELDMARGLELRLKYSILNSRELTKQLFEMVDENRRKKECIANGQRLLSKFLPKEPCTICLDENNMANVILPCFYHRFCQICVERMMKVNPCCPECRTPFSIDEIAIF